MTHEELYRDSARVRAAFFCLSDERDFVALAALINSIRDVGHREPIFVTDCGLTDAQRLVLKDHVTLIMAPEHSSSTPDLDARGLPARLGLEKAFGPLLVEPDVAVILDADVVVLRPLTDLLGDRPVFFRDYVPDRCHPDWSRLGYRRLGEAPYVNAGHLIISRSSGLLPLYRDAVEKMLHLVRSDPTTCRSFSDPFFLGDQDALNALLGSIDPDSYLVSDEAAYWPFEGTLDRVRLLHHIMAKPWLTPLRSSPYTRHMVRLLAQGPVRIPPAHLPPFLREGFFGELHRNSRAVRYRLGDVVDGRIPRFGIRTKLASSLRARSKDIAVTRHEEG